MQLDIELLETVLGDRQRLLQPVALTRDRGAALLQFDSLALLLDSLQHELRFQALLLAAGVGAKGINLVLEGALGVRSRRVGVGKHSLRRLALLDLPRQTRFQVRRAV